jgi:HAD superfamily hydrolase (TIGR01549 family)
MVADTRSSNQISRAAVVFDAGETLFSEQRSWNEWAEWLEVPSAKLLSALDDAIRRRQHHKTAFESVRPDLSFDQQRERRRAEGFVERFTAEDLYPDALPTIARLKYEGYLVGIVGNHPRGMPDVLRELEPRLDFVASSEAWGAAKPEPRFFQKVIEEMSLPAGRVVYVGDRLDNDVLPALAAGMKGVFLRRGPWGREHREWPEAAKASAQIDALNELPELLPALLARVEEPPPPK